MPDITDPALQTVKPQTELSFAQISECAREAQIAFCLDKYPSYDIALARKVEAAIAAQAQAAIDAREQERATLMRFYGVESLDALVAAQAQHIEKLQSKLKSAPSFAPQRVREG